MVTTYELIQEYLTKNIKGDGKEVCDYELNGSIITVRYSEPYIYSDGRSYDNYLRIELLDYLTFLFNKNNEPRN